MVLKQIIVKRIQSLDEVVFDLPPTGLVVFSGQNSNGKSIVGKATRSLLNGDLRKPRKRASLVNRNSSFGEITYVRDDNVRLTLHVAREANLTWVKYEEPDKDPIVRYLADRNYDDLVQRFGWHYDKESGISLNLAEEEDALLFYKTSNKINCSVLETATSDHFADAAFESVQNSLKEARAFKDQWMSNVRTISGALNELTVEDISILKPVLTKVEKLYRNLSAVYFPTIPDIEPVPKVHYTDVYYPKIPDIKYPKVYNVECTIPDILDVSRELKALREHKCPTCGRGFDNCDC